MPILVRIVILLEQSPRDPSLEGLLVFCEPVINVQFEDYILWISIPNLMKNISCGCNKKMQITEGGFSMAKNNRSYQQYPHHQGTHYYPHHYHPHHYYPHHYHPHHYHPYGYHPHVIHPYGYHPHHHYMHHGTGHGMHHGMGHGMGHGTGQ